MDDVCGHCEDVDRWIAWRDAREIGTEAAWTSAWRFVLRSWARVFRDNARRWPDRADDIDLAEQYEAWATESTPTAAGAE